MFIKYNLKDLTWACKKSLGRNYLPEGDIYNLILNQHKNEDIAYLAQYLVIKYNLNKHESFNAYFSLEGNIYLDITNSAIQQFACDIDTKPLEITEDLEQEVCERFQVPNEEIIPHIIK